MATDDQPRPLGGFLVRGSQSGIQDRITVRRAYYAMFFLVGACSAAFVLAQDIFGLFDSRGGVSDAHDYAFLVMVHLFPTLTLLYPIAYGIVQAEPTARRLRDTLWCLTALFGLFAVYFYVALFHLDLPRESDTLLLDPGSWQFWWAHRYPFYFGLVALGAILFTPPLTYLHRRFGASSLAARSIEIGLRLVALGAAIVVLTFVWQMYHANPPASLPETRHRYSLPQEAVPLLIAGLVALGGALAAFASFTSRLRIWSSAILWLLFTISLALVPRLWLVNEVSGMGYVRAAVSLLISIAVMGAPVWLYLSRRYWRPIP